MHVLYCTFIISALLNLLYVLSLFETLAENSVSDSRKEMQKGSNIHCANEIIMYNMHACRKKKHTMQNYTAIITYFHNKSVYSEYRS